MTRMPAEAMTDNRFANRLGARSAFALLAVLILVVICRCCSTSSGSTSSAST